jgi:transposase
MTEIANECNISGDTIRRYLLKYNIPIHHTKELGNLEGYDIYDLYVNKKMSAKQIVELVKCSHDTIINKLNALGITGRTMSESQFNYLNKDINPLLLDRNWLYETYIENGISAKEIGEMIGHCAGTIRRWLKKHKIKLRSNAESKIELMSGSKHPNWQGGISELKALCREYFTVNIVPKIAERDNYTCQLCNKQHCVLHIHHIYSFKDIIQDIISKYSNLDVENPQDKEKLYYIIVNDSLFNDESNLITYCKECHLFKIHKYIQRQSATKSR